MKQNKNLSKTIRKAIRALLQDSNHEVSILNTKYQGKRIICYPEFWNELNSSLTNGVNLPIDSKYELLSICEVSTRKIELEKHLISATEKIRSISKVDLIRKSAYIHELSVLQGQIPFLKSVFIPRFDRFGVSAFKKIMDELKANAQESSTPITRELLCDFLKAWELFIQMEYLNEMEDALINGLYLMEITDGEKRIYPGRKGFSEVEELAKQQLRRQILSRLSKDRVSGENQFKAKDSTLKTNEGFAPIMISGGTITESAPGTTWLTVNKLTEKDANGNVILSKEARELQADHLLNYYYRMEFQAHYVPKDEDEIKHLFVRIDELNKDEIPVHMVTSIGCWLSAFSSLHRHDLMTRNDLQIPRLFEQMREMNKADETLSDENKNGMIADFLSSYEQLIDAEKKTRLMDNIIQLSEPEMLAYLNLNLDLKGVLGDAKLLAVTRFMAENEFPGLFYKDNQSFLLSRVLTDHDSLSHFYNNVILKFLYQNIQGKPERNAEVTKNQTKREKVVCASLAKYFVDYGLQAINDVKFASESINPGDLDGQFDVIVADAVNKTILLIEIKLKNTHVADRERKQEWYTEKILGIDAKSRGAVQQIEAYLKYFKQSDCGKALVKERFGIESLEGYNIVPLIVTDNFYFDHSILGIPSFPEQSVRMVSFFELKMLLQSVDPFEYKYPAWGIYHLQRILSKYPERLEAKEMLNQIHPYAVQLLKETIEYIDNNKIPFWESDKPSLSEFIQAIEQNRFWEFLKWFPAAVSPITTTRFEKNIRMEYQ